MDTSVLGHRVTTVNIFVGPITDVMDREQDPFTYITIECYTPKEFYSVIINIGTSKKSTAGYSQYFVYKATNDYTDIDTT